MSAQADNATPVRKALLYPLPPDGDKHRYAFEFELATEALRSSRQDAGKLTWSTQVMSLSRARVALEKGQLDLIHSFATDELDKRLTPVRFDADKGLNSWRVLVARCEDLPALGQHKRMADLSRQRFGLLASWSDRQSLQQLGYRIAPTQTMDALFAMLSMGRSDVILSGLLHLRFVREALTHHPNLCIEPHLAIQLDRGLRFYTAPPWKARDWLNRCCRAFRPSMREEAWIR